MCVDHVIHLIHSTLRQVLEVVWGGDAELVHHVVVGAGTQLVEDVEAPLAVIQGVNARFLQQEVRDLAA